MLFGVACGRILDVSGCGGGGDVCVCARVWVFFGVERGSFLNDFL